MMINKLSLVAAGLVYFLQAVHAEEDLFSARMADDIWESFLEGKSEIAHEIAADYNKHRIHGCADWDHVKHSMKLGYAKGWYRKPGVDGPSLTPDISELNDVVYFFLIKGGKCGYLDFWHGFEEAEPHKWRWFPNYKAVDVSKDYFGGDPGISKYDLQKLGKLQGGFDAAKAFRVAKSWVEKDKEWYFNVHDQFKHGISMAEIVQDKSGAIWYIFTDNWNGKDNEVYSVSPLGDGSARPGRIDGVKIRN